MTQPACVPTPDALFRACYDQPECDTARLVYADCLDEQDPVRVPCPACGGKWGFVSVDHGRPQPASCEEMESRDYRHERRWEKCPSCGGTGEVIDTADADLAELCRVQVELARDVDSMLPDCNCFPDADGCHSRECPRGQRLVWLTRLRPRERAILDRRPEWHSALRMPCPWCAGIGFGGAGQGGHTSGVRCETCHGTGDLLRYTGDRPPNQYAGDPRNPTLHRGLTLRVECRLDEVMREVLSYRDMQHFREEQGGKIVWQPTPWASAFYRECVGLRRVPWVVPVDRDVGGAAKSFLRDDTLREVYSLPGVLFDAVYKLRRHNQRDGVWLYFTTPEAARVALESAVNGWLRANVT